MSNIATQFSGGYRLLRVTHGFIAPAEGLSIVDEGATDEVSYDEGLATWDISFTFDTSVGVLSPDGTSFVWSASASQAATPLKSGRFNCSILKLSIDLTSATSLAVAQTQYGPTIAIAGPSTSGDGAYRIDVGFSPDNHQTPPPLTAPWDSSSLPSGETLGPSHYSDAQFNAEEDLFIRGTLNPA